MLRGAAEQVEIGALREEYERLLVWPRAAPCSPYESLWRGDQPKREQGRLMAACAADVARLYADLGLRVRADAHELPDHLVVEWEALAYAFEHDSADAAGVLLVGRGGEGVVLASQLLADTLARAGFWVQSFPEFKAERRGAPISGFLRWDDAAPIHRRYKVGACDVLVALSASPPAAELIARVRPGGLMLLNRETRFPASGQIEIARLPASLIARRNDVLSAEGRPMGNVAMLGACVKLLVAVVSSSWSRPSSRAWERARSRTSGLRGRLRALPPAAPGRGRRADRLRPCSTAASRATALSGQQNGFARQPHGLLVARAPRAPRRLHRLCPVCALLPRGRDHESRRLDGDRLRVLQGLRHLRGGVSGAVRQ